MEKSIELLQEANAEIKKLRKTNELQSARLTMFDDIVFLLNTHLTTKDQAMSPDLVGEIERFIEQQPKA